MKRWRWVPGTAAWCALFTGVPAGAQTGTEVRPGEVVERIVAQVDTGQAYAFYVPFGYSGERPRPILFVMDPRGRAQFALELFIPAAEELGWIVASSYDSHSDVSEDRNTPAFNAMLDDVQRRVAIDPRRLYLAGLSGTAESSWFIALAMSGHVAGIVVAGYGLPYEALVQVRYMEDVPTFAVYGTAGRTGYNFEDVYDMDGALDDVGVPNRIAYFDGGHEWMPPELARDALHWLELRAMRSGLAQPDFDFMGARLKALLERAEALENEGWILEAETLLDGSLADLAESAAVITDVRDRLANSPESSVQMSRRFAESREASEYSKLLRARFGGRSGDGASPDPYELARELGVPELLERSRSNDPAEALQARRLAASTAVLASFYGPRTALQKGSPEHALALLAVGEMLQPGNPGMCRLRAFAHAQLGETDAALEALQCWTQWAKPEPEALEAEPYLDPLRDEPGFLALVDSLRGR